MSSHLNVLQFINNIKILAQFVKLISKIIYGKGKTIKILNEIKS